MVAHRTRLVLGIVAAAIYMSGCSISTQTVRYKTDGQELEKVGFTYVLRKTNEGWKVAALVGHDPTSVLRLD